MEKKQGGGILQKAHVQPLIQFLLKASRMQLDSQLPG